MATCASCAHELEDGDRFCTNCGARVSGDASSAGFEVVAPSADDPRPLEPERPAESERPLIEVVEVGDGSDASDAGAAAAPDPAPAKVATRAPAPEPPPLSPRRIAVGVVLALAVVIAGLVFAFSRRGASHSTSATSLVRAIAKEPVSRWKATVRGSAYGARTDGDTVFVVSAPADGDVQLVALKATDGSTLWSKPIAPKSSVASLRLFSGGLAVAVVGADKENAVMLFDRVSGVQKWKAPLDEAYAFSDGYLGPYLYAKNGDEQVLGLLDMGQHRVTRTARGGSVSAFGGTLVTVSEGRISILDQKTFERSRSSIVADDKAKTAVVVGEVVVAAVGKDLIGFDKTGKSTFTERLSVGDITSLRPIGGSRVAASGADGAAVVSVTATKADILWDQKRSAVVGTERLRSTGYVLLGRLDAGRLSLVDGSAKDPGERGSVKFATGPDAGTNAFIADGGVYTFTAVDGTNRLTAYDLKSMVAAWELKGRTTKTYFGVVDQAVVSYTPAEDATVVELER